MLMDLINDNTEVSNWIIYVVKVLKFAFIYIKLRYKFILENQNWALEIATASFPSNIAIISLISSKCSQ
jgi:hypothetical protein